MERNKSELNVVLLIFHQVGLNVNLIHFYPRLPLILSFSFISINFLISYFGFSPWTISFFWWNSTHFFSVWLSSLLFIFSTFLIEFRMWNAFIWLRFNQFWNHFFTHNCHRHSQQFVIFIQKSQTERLTEISSSSSSVIYHCYGCFVIISSCNRFFFVIMYLLKVDIVPLWYSYFICCSIVMFDVVFLWKTWKNSFDWSDLSYVDINIVHCSLVQMKFISSFWCNLFVIVEN